MAAIMLAPTPAGLSLAGQRIIAIMVFTVFMWITEAIPYGASAVVAGLPDDRLPWLLASHGDYWGGARDRQGDPLGAQRLLEQRLAIRRCGAGDGCGHNQHGSREARRLSHPEARRNEGQRDDARDHYHCLRADVPHSVGDRACGDPRSHRHWSCGSLRPAAAQPGREGHAPVGGDTAVRNRRWRAYRRCAESRDRELPDRGWRAEHLLRPVARVPVPLYGGLRYRVVFHGHQALQV